MRSDVADAAVAESSKSTGPFVTVFQLKGGQNPNVVRKNHSVA
jgi:hypothetical protein